MDLNRPSTPREPGLEERLQEALSQTPILPSQRFHRRMAQAPWATEVLSQERNATASDPLQRRRAPQLRRLAFAAATLILLLGLIWLLQLSENRGQPIAQGTTTAGVDTGAAGVPATLAPASTGQSPAATEPLPSASAPVTVSPLGLFTIASSDLFSGSRLAAPALATLSPQDEQARCQPTLEAAAAQAGFTPLIVSAADLPPGLALQCVTYVAETSAMVLTYASPERNVSVTISESGGGYPGVAGLLDGDIGLSAEVIPIQVDQTPGEYVAGNWIFTYPSATTIRAEWRTGEPVEHLRWISQSLHFAISAVTTGNGTFGPQKLAALAASLRPTPSSHSILDDVRVRQAIAYCTDRAALVRAAYPWLAEPGALEAEAVLPPGYWASSGDPGFDRYPFSPEQGAALLEQAGWALAAGATYRTNADGQELALTLTMTDTPLRQAWAAAWEEQLKACGLRLDRKPVPADWLYSADNGLARRDFEMAAFAGSASLDLEARYACDQIPSADNGWQGQNYAGWCNPAADAAVKAAAASLGPDEQRAAAKALLRAYAQDVPGLPLFYRADIYAVNPALENFAPPDDGVHTWNAAQWRLPGKDTIVIGEDAEPAGPLWFEPSYVAAVIRALIMGSDVAQRNGQYQPVLLKHLPSVENRGGQPVVTYEFVDGLTWSDGVPVTQADYELGYRALCDPAARVAGQPSTCDQIAEVKFLGDTSYRVTWLPGSSQGVYLPPFGRLPAHQRLADGRTLADVPPAELPGLDALYRAPLGVGPYVLKEWEPGKEMLLEANPYYVQGPPTTPRIVVKFYEHDQAIRALLAGEVDVLDVETLTPDDIARSELAQANQAGTLRLIAVPSSTWEQVEFALAR